jgi:peptidoglycan/LPS O-acetylase OafA/YrhL
MSAASKHIPALDGLRGVAVLLVFASHVGIPGFATGGVAVDIFFVLSGYLITTILVGEIERTGTIALPRFYLRRIRRLAPALLLMALLYGILAPLVLHDRSAAGQEELSLLSFLYLMDYARAFFIGHNALVHTWSLAVEEHFYLVWPLALLALARWVPFKRWLTVLAIAYLAATAWRCLSIDIFGWRASYFRFDTRLSALILGSLLAVLFSTETSPRARNVWTLALIAGGVGMTAFACWYYDGAATTGGWGTLGIALAEAASLRMILNVVERHRNGTSGFLSDVLSRRTLVQLGKISYGLYLYHYPLTYWLYGKDWRLVLAVTLPATLAIAALSYRYLEQPILNGRALPRLFRPVAPERAAWPGGAEPAPPALTPIKATGPV